jgi:hypothetical protein
MTTPSATDANPKPKPWRADYGYLPAIPFEIVKAKHSR